jgi:tetratricopeptide (TPR) repeat protein
MVGVLHWFWYRRGYISEGRTWCQRFMALTGEKHRTMSRALFLVGSGNIALMQGDLVEADQQLQESIAISRELQDEQWLTVALTVWGILARFQGDTVTAQRAFEETLALGERLDMWWFVVLSLLNLGNVAATYGDFSTARDRLEQAAGLAKRNDDTWLMASVLNNLGEVARIQGDYRQAQRSYLECQALRESGEKPDIARLLHNLGYVTLRLGDCEQARANFQESLSLFQDMGNKRGMAECVAGLASLAVVQDQPQQAARLLAAAEAQLRAAGASWWPADQVEYERNLALIRTVLDPETFDTAWTQGQAMSLAEAIAEALS